MNIDLTNEQLEWVNIHVERGDFASAEDAVRLLVKEGIALRLIEEGDDLAWAKPYVEEALADIARGNVITLEEHQARNDARLAAFKD